MSLLLDALKKSEAQRRRGKPATVDLARTPPSTRPARSGRRWLIVVLPLVALAAAGLWLWPEISGRLAGGPVTDDRVAQREDDGAAVAGAEPGEPRGRLASASTPRNQVLPAVEPAPVAGAGRVREAANPAGEAADANAAEAPVEARAETPASAQQQAEPPSEPRPEPRPAAVRASEPASPAESEPRVEPEPDPRENFIRAWELPQAQRAEFPELNLTVHFYTPEPRDRFVRINGERYAEGQLVQRGVRLAEIRQRGAVVDFAGYRVLIE